MEEITKVGSIPQGSNIEFPDLLIQADLIPYEIAPITSKGLLEINHEFAFVEFVEVLK
jgi:hypothetical protein